MLLERFDIHFLDLQRWDHHALDNIGEQGCHVVITHGHIGHNFLQSNLLACEVLIFLVALKFSTELSDFTL